jgi:exopolysaccharide biosynthesis polyprenyl glycosylphosphotransferase
MTEPTGDTAPDLCVLELDQPGAVLPASRSAPRRAAAITRACLVLSDLLLTNVAFVVAYIVRYELEIGPNLNEFQYAPLSFYFPVQAFLSVSMLVTLTLKGLYSLRHGTELLDELGAVLSAVTINVAVVVVLFFMLQPGHYSRGVLVYTWFSLVLFLGVGKTAARALLGHLRRKGIGARRMLVIGGGYMGKMIMQQIASRPSLGYTLVGFLDDTAWAMHTNFGRFAVLGATDDVERVVRRERVDDVVIALPSHSHARIIEIVERCRRLGVEFRLVPDLYEMSLSRVDVDDVAGIPLIAFNQVSIHGVNLFIKRAIDITLAACGLLLAAVPMAIIALLIKLDSEGEIIFRQTRVGRGGRHFTLYKFRTMRKDAEALLPQLAAHNEAGGPIFKMKNDPRCTRVGRILRRLSLDELPQLWNVLRGDISLVGPRAPIPREVERYEEWHKKRLEVTPGLTGLWQVSGRSSLTFDEMVMLDIYYIENWSLALDLKILLKTIPAVLAGSGAY